MLVLSGIHWRTNLIREAQKVAIASYVKDDKVIIAEFQDIELGKNADLPALTKANALSKEKGATLIIAKPDRLSSSLTFISSLMDNKDSFYFSASSGAIER